MKILHIGVFDRNIGDSVALVNVQKSFIKYLPNVSFTNYTIENFWKHNNNVEKCSKYFSGMCSDYDAILVGGGGLLEYAAYGKNGTKYKLPFNEAIFNHISIPVYFYGVGVNIFRGGIDYSSEAKISLQDTINRSTAFTVRNDGSFNKLENWIKVNTSKVEIVPDPGLLHLNEFGVEDKSSVKIGAIQPAFNASQGINKHRFGNDSNVDYLKKLFSSYISFPHTVKDFGRLGGESIISEKEFHSKYKKTDKLYEYLKKYTLIDYVVAMRGHGQIITIGMNIPGIYLSTQDKVRDFSIENGFENYNVDILEDNWKEKLENKLKQLTEPNSRYLKEWYDIRHSFIKKCHEIDKQFFVKYFNAV